MLVKYPKSYSAENFSSSSAWTCVGLRILYWTRGTCWASCLFLALSLPNLWLSYSLLQSQALRGEPGKGTILSSSVSGRGLDVQSWSFCSSSSPKKPPGFVLLPLKMGVEQGEGECRAYSSNSHGSFGESHNLSVCPALGDVELLGMLFFSL